MGEGCASWSHGRVEEGCFGRLVDGRWCLPPGVMAASRVFENTAPQGSDHVAPFAFPFLKLSAPLPAESVLVADG